MRLEHLEVDELLNLARNRGASDLHLATNERPSVRVDGHIHHLDREPHSALGLDRFARATLNAATLEHLDARGSADVVIREAPGAPYRLHIVRRSGGLRIAVRYLAEHPPAFEATGLPPSLAGLSERGSGLLVVSGPTGSGKTTALAALVDRLNRTGERIILTVEDPIEYLHRSQRASISHCEIGIDVPDYATALRSFLRADPDVLLIGEIRDAPTAQAVIDAAETGHLVLTTTHAGNAPKTIDRIVDLFPISERETARSRLATCLLAVVGMRLVPARSGSGRLPACEILIATDAVRALIRDGKTHHLHNAMTTARSLGMQTFEVACAELLARQLIDGECLDA
jgi:twitching motility protein PilT